MTYSFSNVIETIPPSATLALNARAAELKEAGEDVVNMAKDKDVAGTYSCHAGNDEPCGGCISCQEFLL